MDKGIIFAAGVSIACLGAFAIGYRMGSNVSNKPKEHNNMEHLAHHGVTGQKWGVGRCLNADGSLTKSSVKEVKHNYISTESKRKLSDKILDKAIDRATQKIIDNAKVDISITF